MTVDYDTNIRMDLCKDCYDAFVKELESKKTCKKCVFFEQHEDSSFCRKMNLKLKLKVSAIGPALSPLDYVRLYYLQAERCINYITEEEYEERALRGEIGKEEKEITKMKEVIVKVRCPYCRHLYDETLDRCPHCGGGR